MNIKLLLIEFAFKTEKKGKQRFLNNFRITIAKIFEIKSFKIEFEYKSKSRKKADRNNDFSFLHRSPGKRKRKKYEKNCIGLRYGFKIKSNGRCYNLGFWPQATINNLPVIYILTIIQISDIGIVYR